MKNAFAMRGAGYDGPVAAAIMIGVVLLLGWVAPPASAQQDRADGDPATHLFFAGTDGFYLRSEKREMPDALGPAGKGREIVHALIGGPQSDLIPTLPPETKIRAFYVAPGGFAYIDLNPTIRDNHPGGVHTERLSVYSIVNSLVLNVPEIKRVKILIDGQEAPTLAGHIDLRFPFQADMLLIR